MLRCEKVEFTTDETRRQAYTTAKFLKVLATNCMGVRDVRWLGNIPFPARNRKKVQA